ncbi:hypothetical protein [Halorussus ruber]|uniref:hypothetical protein n=1 Tax=Halorussus ruber TaxID=1126238 RepID=UPI00143D1831|nr:hypothetical protein [Halorussus ruber]
MRAVQRNGGVPKPELSELDAGVRRRGVEGGERAAGPLRSLARSREVTVDGAH